jgi:hypothetical protein
MLGLRCDAGSEASPAVVRGVGVVGSGNSPKALLHECCQMFAARVERRQERDLRLMKLVGRYYYTVLARVHR